jgi:hypothetical protein
MKGEIIMRKLALTTSIAALTMIAASAASAETVHTRTYVEPQATHNVIKVDFSDFDLNKDGLYAKSEVGEKLFYMFDLDGNEVIDNNEWTMEKVYTIVPMKKETYRFVDYNNDGYTDLSTYTVETFFEESGLARFDENKDGLSAKEFIGEGYQSLDDNDNGTIELDEWKEAYSITFKPEAAEQERYN